MGMFETYMEIAHEEMTSKQVSELRSIGVKIMK